MHLNQEALAAAYASLPVDKRDMTLIACAVRAYIDADTNWRSKIETAVVLREMQAVASGEYDGHDETLDPWTADNRVIVDDWQKRLSRYAAQSLYEKQFSEFVERSTADVQYWKNEAIELQTEVEAVKSRCKWAEQRADAAEADCEAWRKTFKRIEQEDLKEAEAIQLKNAAIQRALESLCGDYPSMAADLRTALAA